MTRLRLSLALVLCTSAFAAGNDPVGGQLPSIAPPSQAELEKPILSQNGKKRLLENVRVLEGNLRDLNDNITAADKNIETVKSELKDLEALEKEHVELRKKYQAYLAQADTEVKKNDKAKRDLAKWEESHKDAAKNGDAALKDKMEAARLEQVDRDRWKFDADTKTARVKELLAGLDRNLRDIASRRKPLEQQLALWTNRKADYQKRIGETETKKAQWEGQLNR